MSELRNNHQADPPRTQLESWSIRRISVGELFIVGIDVGLSHGCVSAPIAELNARTRVATTLTGRTYDLVGAAGYNIEAELAWMRLVREAEVSGWKDVTPELCPDWRNAAPESKRQSILRAPLVASLDGMG
jgi:hypothetical protein